MISGEELDSFIDINLLSLAYSKRQLFSDIVRHPILVNDKWEIISNFNSKFSSKDFYENFNEYWVDSIRLTTLFSESNDEKKNELIFNTYKANEYSLLLTKIWNANRYICGKYKEKYWDTPIKIKDILESINDEWVSDYDNWMLHNLKIIIDDFKYQISEWNYLSLWEKLLENYITQFCDKYINITKVLKKAKTEDIMFFVWLTFLELLYPYIPNFATDIKNKFNVDWGWISVLWLSNIQLKEKNYKINIFTDIIDKIASMKAKIWLKKQIFRIGWQAH